VGELVLREGRSFWRREHASSVAFLVDARAYFEALADALERARRSVLIAGWDFHSRLRLRRGSDGGGEGPELHELLRDLVERRPSLHVHILIWDFALLYAFEREALPSLLVKARLPERVSFHLDESHPVGASHHQKIVVIDDAIAFVGGIDLTSSRWDTRCHRADDPRRVDPWGEHFGPFHDVQMAVGGDAASSLGDLLRERWRRATGEKLEPVGERLDPWPRSLRAAVSGVDVAIARTEPHYGAQPEVREIEALYLDAIASARRTIYIENQYLTCDSVAEALRKRLGEAEGPEIVIVGPETCSGWLEEAAMGTKRARLLAHLRGADERGRLAAYHPVVDGRPVHVHAKVMVVDDDLLIVGSANLSNRSMGVDTECALAIEAAGAPDLRERIAALRNDLAAEHLGSTADEVAEGLARGQSLIETIESLRGGARTLAPLEPSAPSWVADVIPERPLFDPDAPMEIEEDLFAEFVPDLAGEGGDAGADSSGASPRFQVMAAILVLLALAATWRLTPLGDHLNPEAVLTWAAWARSLPYAPLVGAVIFTAASLAMVPVTALIVATALVYGPWLGFGISLTGSVLSAALAFGVGSRLWHGQMSRLDGRLHRLSRRLARRGVIAVAALRMVPVAPFTVVNVAAGISHIRLRDFVLGTMLGLAPGTLALTVLAEGAASAVREPSLPTALFVVVLAALLLLGLRALYLRARARARRDEES
jgi:phospholipase D1/2